MSFNLTLPKTVKLKPLTVHDEKNAFTVRSAVCSMLKPDCNMFTKGEIAKITGTGFSTTLAENTVKV